MMLYKGPFILLDEGIFLFLPDGFLFVGETRFWLTGACFRNGNTGGRKVS